jgi:hypothetical protein
MRHCHQKRHRRANNVLRPHAREWEPAYRDPVSHKLIRHNQTAVVLRHRSTVLERNGRVTQCPASCRRNVGSGYLFGLSRRMSALNFSEPPRLAIGCTAHSVMARNRTDCRESNQFESAASGPVMLSEIEPGQTQREIRRNTESGCNSSANVNSLRVRSAANNSTQVGINPICSRFSVFPIPFRCVCPGGEGSLP